MNHTRRQFIATSVSASAVLSTQAAALAQESVKTPFHIPRCRIVPQANHQTSFELAGKETTRWHFGTDYPRPYFYPFLGPSGTTLTRMGHPGAPDHDHHQSIWLAHNDVNGVSFWANRPDAGIVRQKQWLCYEDSDAHAIMAVRLSWIAPNPDHELMDQTLVAINRPGENGEHTLELQCTFRASKEPVQLGKTNFGFLAVRVAKSISVYFGGGKLTDSEGRINEPAIFGKQALWMDYSGPVREGVTEGLTFFDHPANPRSPTHWHVRSDGWMGAAPCLQAGITITPDSPLKLRYLLFAHHGEVDARRATNELEKFASYPFLNIVKGTGQHRQFETQTAER